MAPLLKSLITPTDGLVSPFNGDYGDFSPLRKKILMGGMIFKKHFTFN